MKHNLFSRLTCLLLVVASIFCLTTSALAAESGSFKPHLLSGISESFSSADLVSSTLRDTVTATFVLEYCLEKDADLDDFDFTRNSYIGRWNDGNCIDVYLAKKGGTGYYNLFFAPSLDEITIYTAHSTDSQSSLVKEFPNYYSVSGSDLRQGVRNLLDAILSD